MKSYKNKARRELPQAAPNGNGHMVIEISPYGVVSARPSRSREWYVIDIAAAWERAACEAAGLNPNPRRAK